MTISIADLNKQLKGTGITAKWVGGRVHYYARAMYRGNRMSATFYTLEEAQEAILDFKRGRFMAAPKVIPPSELQTQVVRAGTRMLPKSEAFLLLADAPFHMLDAGHPYQTLDFANKPIIIPRLLVAEFIHLSFYESETLDAILTDARKVHSAQEILNIYEEETQQQLATGLLDPSELPSTPPAPKINVSFESEDARYMMEANKLASEDENKERIIGSFFLNAPDTDKSE